MNEFGRSPANTLNQGSTVQNNTLYMRDKQKKKLK